MSSSHELRAYLVPDGHGQSRTRLDDPPIQAALRTRIKELARWSTLRFQEAAVKLGNIIKWAIIVFVVWWIVQQPAHAAHLVHNIGNLLSSAANGLSNFFTSI
jgi:hypothetical protein